MSLTHELADLIRAKKIADDDLSQAALFVLDALANAIAGRDTAPGRMLLQWGTQQADDAGRQAFVIGGLTHILEVDDLHRASVVHPGCVVVPAAVTVARREGHRGVALLRSVLHGFEACCRVGMAVGPAHYRIWHNTATCGPFGSAMAAATLLGLTADEITHALGNAGTQSSGLWQFLETGAMSKHLHAGRAAESGVIAADLAQIGFSGPPAILEGDKGFFRATCPDAQPDAVLRAPEGPWQLHQTSIKPWPCCRHTHPTIDAALALFSEIDAAQVEQISISTYGAALNVCDRPLPESEYEAKFSLQHCAAAALSDGAVAFASFDGDARERLAPLRSRISVTSGEPFASNYPAHWGSRISVNLVDGDARTVETVDCKGDPEYPLTREEMVAKARGLLVQTGLNPEETASVIDQILGLADDGPTPNVPDWVTPHRSPDRFDTVE